MVIRLGEGQEVMGTCIKLHHDKFLCQQASHKVAMKWLYQRQPATEVCVQGVPKGWEVVAIFLIFWLLHIRSKSSKGCVPVDVWSPSHRGVVSEAVPPSPGEMTVKSHDHLRVVSHQQLIMSGDVETNPGPLDGKITLHVANHM